MKQTLAKRLSLLLSLLLLFSCLGVSVFAEAEEDERDRNSIGAVEWSFSEDGMTLSDGVTTYRYYSGDYPLVVYSDQVFRYVGEPYHPLLSGFYDPYSRKDNDDVVWFDTGDSLYVYATEGAAERLDALFTSPTYFRLTMENGYAAYTADLDKSTVEDYDAARLFADRNVTFPVSALRDCNMYLLTAMDEDNCFGYVYGAIFDVNGLFYYLHYPSLDNSYFDANGDLSFRRGELTLVELSEDETADLLGVIDSMTYYDYEYESEGIYKGEGEEDYRQSTVAAFWVLYALLGFVAPLLFLIPALKMPKKERYGKPKHWYLLAVFAAAWVFLALAILLVMVL